MLAAVAPVAQRILLKSSSVLSRASRICPSLACLGLAKGERALREAEELPGTFRRAGAWPSGRAGCVKTGGRATGSLSSATPQARATCNAKEFTHGQRGSSIRSETELLLSCKPKTADKELWRRVLDKPATMSSKKLNVTTGAAEREREREKQTPRPCSARLALRAAATSLFGLSVRSLAPSTTKQFSHRRTSAN